MYPFLQYLSKVDLGNKAIKLDGDYGQPLEKTD